METVQKMPSEPLRLVRTHHVQKKRATALLRLRLHTKISRCLRRMTLPVGSGHIQVILFLGIVQSSTAQGPVLHLLLYSLYIDIGSKDRPEV